MNLTIAAIAFGIAYCLTLAASYYWQRRYVELERRHIDAQARLGGALADLERAEQREREWEALCAKWKGACEETLRERDQALGRLAFERSIKVQGSLHYRN